MADTREAQTAPVRALLRNFSLETTPHARDEIERFPGFLKRGTCVYVAHPPNCRPCDVVASAARLKELGFEPVPHLVARKLGSRQALDETLGELSELGIDRLLTVAGDLEEAKGPYHSTLDVLESGLLVDHGFRSVGVAGHPEGNPAIGTAGLEEALRAKARWAAATGLATYVLTQFVLNPQSVIDWERSLRRAGIELPVRVGMAGKVSLKRLLRYAVRCGVVSSARTIAGRVRAASAAVRPVGADEQLDVIARHRTSHEDCAIAGTHFYAFGGAENTVRWLESLAGQKGAKR